MSLQPSVWVDGRELSLLWVSRAVVGERKNKWAPQIPLCLSDQHGLPRIMVFAALQALGSSSLANSNPERYMERDSGKRNSQVSGHNPAHQLRKGELDYKDPRTPHRAEDRNETESQEQSETGNQTPSGLSCCSPLTCSFICLPTHCPAPLQETYANC